MKKFICTIFLLVSLPMFAQGNRGNASEIRHGASLPASCDSTQGQIFFLNGTGLYECTAANTWTRSGSSSPSSGLQDPGSNGIVKRTALDTTSVATSSDVVGLFSTCSGVQYLGADGACHVPTSTQTHTFTIPIAGAPIVTGQSSVSQNLGVVTGFSCTINTVRVVSAISGSITVDIWKANGAIPTAANKISASDPAALSSATYSTDATLTGWTTSVVDGDIFRATVATADGVLTNVNVVIGCR